MWKPILAVALGSAAGGILRWLLSQRLNPLLANLPLGTLCSNLVAGYLVGLAIAWSAQAPGLSPEWRLLVITGFCGGLSTFSTFSAEVVGLLQRGAIGWAAGTIAVHLGGSLLATFAGMATMQGLRTTG
jgi:CrcB protein